MTIILTIPAEIRVLIYGHLVDFNYKLPKESNHDVLETRVSFYPHGALLLVNRQLRSEYLPFVKQVLCRSKLLISTSLTWKLSDPYPSIPNRVGLLLKEIPHVVVQSIGDCQWFVGNVGEDWPSRLVGSISWQMSHTRQVEYICRLAGGLVFLPWGGQPSPGNQKNLKAFFQHDPVTPNFGSAILRSDDVGLITKTLILEPAALVTIRQATSQRFLDASVVFKNFLNGCGANFPGESDWKERSFQPLDPLLRSRPSISDQDVGGYTDGGIVYSVTTLRRREEQMLA